MNMTDYLHEVGFAVERLIEAVWYEREQLQGLGERIRELTGATVRGYTEASRPADNDLDDEGLATAAYWETYFGVDKARLHAENVYAALVAQMTTHGFSVDSLSGALLQIAKQGISLVHGGRGPVPGRPIGTQSLGTVIWEGRNQAMHWDSGTLHQRVELCFQTLATDVDPKFSDYAKRSLAFDIVELLGWRTRDDFNADLLQLGGDAGKARIVQRARG